MCIDLNCRDPQGQRVLEAKIFGLERQSARMSKITNDGLTRSGTGCFIYLYPYGSSGRQRVKMIYDYFRHAMHWQLLLKITDFLTITK